ncbi:acyl-ACP thioesterase [Lentilactobacillus senioris DSM 24302 = JCM 17472]|uniref:Acyl-ACP thioesterase n=1 Tax=Lentilactobacillus senioris DSM 24302 = JCM 17472 TaxID=1423802 RepID=A0A0R2D0F9_9LACO|nr:acyl-ACP thioesterase domain-containing protein [Lentilactobacillus senioris]KRM93436.1 acyl-ACP thioesterase [Lentilactobacillus senioris DSM 24302 = JCM 17472]
MAKKYSLDHQVLYYEGDVTNQMTIAMLLNVVVLTSEAQNRNLGIDHNVLGEQGLGWVVTSYSMKVNRMPRVDELITVTTRGTSYNRFFAFREFWVVDADGQELVKIDSIWVLMDEVKRKITTISPEVVSQYESEAVKKVPRLPRPTAPEAVIAEKNYQIRYNDIDFNGHVNNSRYLEWIVDTLPMTFLEQHNPRTIDIRFENEVVYGQTVQGTVELLGDDSQSISRHEIKFDDTIAALAEITWQKATLTEDK